MLNGIAVLRTYFVLFCGAHDPARRSQALRPREQLGFVMIAAALIVGGIFPGPFVRSRSRAVETMRVARVAAVGRWTAHRSSSTVAATSSAR